MIKEILMIIGLSMTPIGELRAGIPYGLINTNIHWTQVFLIAILANILIGFIVYFFMDKFVQQFLKYQWFNKLYAKCVESPRQKVQKITQKYGEYGLILFIGIPLPGTGAYSGAIGAHLLGLNYKKFIIANCLGVVLAGIIVTTLVMTGKLLL